MACSQLRKLLLALVFVCGFAVPAALLFLVMDGRDLDDVQPEEVQTVLKFSQKDLARENILSHERKTLDYRETSDESDALKFQIHEMQQIKVSVRNELKQLEQERSTLNEEVQKYGDQLSSLRRQVSSAMSELQEYKTKLARIARETNRAGKINYSHNSVPPAPIVLVNVSQRKRLEYRPRQMASSDTVSSRIPVTCTFESCFDFSRCPLSKPFSIYIYNNHKSFSDQFALKHSDVLDLFMSTLSDKHLVTNDPEKACVFVVVVTGPLRLLVTTDSQNPLISLPYWNSDGANHVVIDLSRPDFKKPLSTFNTHLSSRAIFANMWSNRPNYDILIPPLRLEQSDDASHNSLWKGLPMHLPIFRSILVYFEGLLEKCDDELGEDDLWVPVNDLEMIRDAISSKSTDKLLIKTNCDSYLESLGTKNHFDTDGVDSDRGSPGEWSLCGNVHYRSSNLAQSTFTLILGSKTGLISTATYSRIIEGLQFGAIPVFIGIKFLPFQSVIDWSRAAVWVPPPRIGELHVILRSLEPDKVLEYRRQGRFLWETYFSTLGSVFDTILAIVRSKCLHPPPPAPDGDMTIKLLISLRQESVQMVSPVYQQNFTIYSSDFWNSPPGPFFMYPVTPFKSSPVSGRQYEGLSSKDITVLPSHVIQAGGITGPHFEDFLLGNIPDEQFTVLILTYERNQVLIEAIKRLDDLQSLAKVVVVWNSPSPPPEYLKWPAIGVPVEVVSAGRNSLNNRFLPLPNIQTEAILSIDDDVHLRHDEIQFAFRVWREARDRIVGFPGRFHARDVRHSSWLYNSNYTCELSMVLTGAAFVHKYYFYLYSQWMPQVIRDIVDEYINCEDIAMNFLVSHITRKPPLKVTSRWTFRCPGCPENLSSNEEHFNERHICMNKFTEVYGYMPLLYTQFRLDSVLFKTRLPSDLEKCYSFV